MFSQPLFARLATERSVRQTPRRKFFETSEEPFALGTIYIVPVSHEFIPVWAFGAEYSPGYKVQNRIPVDVIPVQVDPGGCTG